MSQYKYFCKPFKLSGQGEIAHLYVLTTFEVIYLILQTDHVNCYMIKQTEQFLFIKATVGITKYDATIVF